MATITVGSSTEGLRISAELAKKAEYAASLRGKTLDEFVASAVAEAIKKVINGEEVIESERTIKLTERDAKFLADILENPPEPSAKLLEIAARHKPIPRE